MLKIAVSFDVLIIDVQRFRSAFLFQQRAFTDLLPPAETVALHGEEVHEAQPVRLQHPLDFPHRAGDIVLGHMKNRSIGKGETDRGILKGQRAHVPFMDNCVNLMRVAIRRSSLSPRCLDLDAMDRLARLMKPNEQGFHRRVPDPCPTLQYLYCGSALVADVQKGEKLNGSHQ